MVITARGRARLGRRPRPVAPPAGARLPVLFLNTPTMPPLGADTWVHAQIMRGLDRDTHDLHAACAFGPTHARTPTYDVLHTVPGLRLLPVTLGPEIAGRSALGKARSLVATVPAIVSLLRLARYVRRHRIPVIHTSDRPRDAAAAVVLARVTGARSIVHVHVGWAEWMSPILQWALRRADALVAVSEFVATTLDDAGHDPARTHVVLNGIDLDRWTPHVGRAETRRALGIPDDAPTVLTVCRLFRGKGPTELIRAVAKVNADRPGVRLLIVGAEMERGYAAELRAEADGLGLHDNVQFLGRRPDVDRLMASADVYAMPSLGEPFGLVFAEAMAMRLPVVALDSGGAPEVVEHGRTGLLARHGDIDELAAYLRDLVGDPERRAVMGDEGRRRVEERFTIGRMSDDMATVYRRVVDGDAPLRGGPS